MNSQPRIDGATAIWSKDADALRNALASGWRLPSLDLQPGHGRPDLTLILRVVAYGWVEGWRIWSHACPQVSRHPIVLEAIISQGQSEILAEVLDQNDGELVWDEDHHAIGPMHLLFQLIGSPLGPQVGDEQLVETARLLSEAGIKVMEPYPGHFVPDGLNMPGHTLWTWALSRGVWGVVEGLMSALDIGDEALVMPKSQQALDRWFEKAWITTWINTKEAGARARKLWLSWMTPARFSHWISGWSRLHELEMIDILLTLPEPLQEIAWGAWLRLSPAADLPLLELVSSLLPMGKIEDALAALRRATPEQEWLVHWHRSDEYGLDAASVWDAKQADARSDSQVAGESKRSH